MIEAMGVCRDIHKTGVGIEAIHIHAAFQRRHTNDLRANNIVSYWLEIYLMLFSMHLFRSRRVPCGWLSQGIYA
jgi:hypothetical protein